MARLAVITRKEPGAAAAALSSILAGSTWAERPHRRSWTGPRAALAAWGWDDGRLTVAEGAVIAVDGRIYNRAVLDPDSSSDGALVAALWRKHGFVDAVRQLNGDFAIALYDEADGVLWLARDRFGVKPLYYADTPAGFASASQPRTLIALPDVDSRVNARYAGLFAGSHYRYFDNDPETSPYAGIAQLPAAHVLRVDGRSVQQSRYWALEDAPDLPGSEATLAQAYRDLLLDAVTLRLQPAQRPAFTLSGGMDSSSVLASAVHVTGRTQVAYSTVYEDPTYDESREIESILEHAVSAWHPIPVGTPDVHVVVERMIDVHDEPVATATWLSHFLLCASVAGAGFSALFGGLGGDELNAGEYEHFVYHFADLRRAGLEDVLTSEIGFWSKYHDHPIYRKSRATVERAFERLVDLRTPGRCVADRARLERYASAINREYFDVRAFQPAMDEPFASYLKNRTFQDLSRETIPPCLRAEDRHAEAFGLETRLPFLDHRLVEFMFRVPGTLKFRDGVSKFLLREATRGILPEETRTRVKKTGWNAPAHRWFAGPGADRLRDIVSSRAFRERGIYDTREVLRLIDEHDEIVTSGRPAENHMMFLWQMLNLEVWLAGLKRQQPRESGVMEAS